MTESSQGGATVGKLSGPMVIDNCGLSTGSAARRGMVLDLENGVGHGAHIGSTMGGVFTQLLTIAAAAQRLQMKPWPVLQLVEGGVLPGAKHDGRWVVREADLDAYVRTLFGEPAAPALPRVALADETRSLISVKEAALHLDLTPASVYKLLDQLAIRSVYQGKRRSVVVDSLREYVERLSIFPGH